VKAKSIHFAARNLSRLAPVHMETLIAFM